MHLFVEKPSGGLSLDTIVVVIEAEREIQKTPMFNTPGGQNDAGINFPVGFLDGNSTLRKLWLPSAHLVHALNKDEPLVLVHLLGDERLLSPCIRTVGYSQTPMASIASKRTWGSVRKSINHLLTID